MKHGSLTRLSRSTRTVRHIGGVAIAALLITSCGNAAAPNPTKSIVVGRQVVLTDVGGNISSIIRMPDGSFVVTGANGTAWAVAINSNAEVLWKYQESQDPRSKTPYQSNLNGAAPLANGRVLLCGESTTKASIGQLTVLDNKGLIIEQRAEIPNDVRHFTSSSIGSCFPWNGGIGVTGGSSNGTQSAPWLMKLDIYGVKQWQIFLTDMVATNPTVLEDHSLVLSRFDILSFAVELVRLNTKGDVEAKRTIKGYGYLQLRSLEPSKTIYVITYGVGNQGTLYTLNGKLEDAELPLSIGSFDAERGSGYVLPDRSLALFGRMDSAAIAWINKLGQPNATTVFDQKYTSFVVSDAAPISTSQFVTVRNSVSPNPNDQGLVIAWITLK
jgi:hypothetical protein